jgi:hypothetical protein
MNLSKFATETTKHEAIDLLSEISENLSEIGLSSLVVKNSMEQIRRIRLLLINLNYEPKNRIILRELRDYLRDLSNRIIAEDLKDMSGELFLYSVNDELDDWHKKLLNPQKHQEERIITNSENFYKNSIEDAKAEVNTLKEELSSLNDKQAIKEKENTIQKLYLDIAEYQAREQERKQREDAIATWESKITNSFLTLDKHIKPIKAEHKLLSKLFRTYSWASALIVLLVIAFELVICNKLYCHVGIPSLSDYLWLVAPIPVALGLLWGFITQLNRAQRQRVVLSRFIHDIKYTEGVLLAINTLATDVSSSTQRINNALDKLLEKHLSYNMWEDKENFLKQQEQKDTVPYEVLIEVIKSLRKS